MIDDDDDSEEEEEDYIETLKDMNSSMDFDDNDDEETLGQLLDKRKNYMPEIDPWF
jgi:hypothetical protein